MVDFSIKDLSFSYPNEKKKALDNISLDIRSGEFIVISGPSGSGKSTLLSMLKPELTPHGNLQGEIIYFGKEKKLFSQRESSEKIGYLLQNSEYQTVTHSVRTELSFGLENLGLDSKTIRLRIAEISAYFSLEKIIDKKTDELSGGQKQLVCLASILAMHPKAVIFDEPTAQLDPMAAQTLLSTIEKLCRENGITVIITEHRLENIIPQADRLIVLQDGKIIADCPPENLDVSLFPDNEYIKSSMPFPMRLFARLGYKEKLPLNIGDGRLILKKLLQKEINDTINREEAKKTENFAVEAKNVWFSYDKKSYVLNSFNLKIPVGSFFAIMGANAAGKSTAVSLMCGILPCKSGEIKIFGKNIKKYHHNELYNGILAFLPQKCESLFSGNTVLEDLQNALSDSGLSKDEKTAKINETANITNITSILNKHPYDISGGEMQRAALAIVLLKNPKIIFMDEPTKGMDSIFKKQFADIIKNLCKIGVTVIMVSHDTDFCAEHCDRCAMIFDGMCITQSDKYDFFANNYFYTTAANKLAREFFPNAVTEEEVYKLCIKNLQK
ncbi:MAG: ATP-binding cassette domain-containing protein [Clostridia bacterium]|nr:ATP-binding cassette domain-containing protein [Clostridia bacterium]